MAEQREPEFPRHQATWRGFVRFLTASSLSIIVTLGLMAIFLL